MKTKLFYRAAWETGHEFDDEYRKWVSKFDNPASLLSFTWVAEQMKGNWRIVWYYGGE